MDFLSKRPYKVMIIFLLLMKFSWKKPHIVVFHN